jgi:RNA polymerase sigma factor (sigma-70 family)
MAKMIEQVRKAVQAEHEAGLTDGQLLQRFLDRRDEDAVAALVRRHGPMVWGVCRRVLRNHHDAEDAFQATFLVLIRRAACVVPRDMVANWLYGVAHQTALKARATAAKRLVREKPMNPLCELPARTDADLWQELQPLLDAELSLLPDKYRAALVLCDLEGKSRKDAARHLKIPEGTLSSRLTTARTMLARRLGRHGFPVSAAVLAVVLSEQAASAIVPAAVAGSTIKAASLFAVGQAACGIVSVPVATLTEGVLKTMFLAKLKTAAAVLVTMTVLGLGGLVATLQTPAAGQDVPDKTAQTAAPAVAPDRPKTEEGNAQDRVPQPPGPDRQPPAKEPPPAGNNAKVQALLKERLDLLKKVAQHQRELYKQGVASQSTVWQADLRVHKGELDLCENARERIAVLEKIVEVSKKMEDQMASQHKSGQASASMLMEATISRLDAEIALEREKARVGGGGR